MTSANLNKYRERIGCISTHFSSNNPSKLARNVIDANEALCQIHIDISQDTQEDMYGADYGHKSDF